MSFYSQREIGDQLLMDASPATKGLADYSGTTSVPHEFFGHTGSEVRSHNGVDLG
jgi:hypothetical protein